MIGERLTAQYRIDGRAVLLDLTGETVRGPAVSLLQDDDDLTQSASWGSEGFVVKPFLSADEFRCLQDKLVERVRATVQLVRGATLASCALLARTLQSGFFSFGLPVAGSASQRNLRS